MEIVHREGLSAAVMGKDEKISGVQSIVETLFNVGYQFGCVGLVVDRDCLGESFFDLKTGYAGELLQKFSTYRLKIAVIGDFSSHPSKSLHDFIYECNKGNCVFFKESVEDGLHALGLPNLPSEKS